MRDLAGARSLRVVETRASSATGGALMLPRERSTAEGKQAFVPRAERRGATGNFPGQDPRPAHPETRKAAPESGLPKTKREEARYAAAVAGSSTRRGISTSRAITSRWICDVPS
jgi:hypothetical protein